MATTFTLSRKTYSTALDSAPLVVNEIDYLNYLEKSFADDDDKSGLALAAGGAVGLGGILGGSYMENNAGDKVINDEIKRLKDAGEDIGNAPKKHKELIELEDKTKGIRKKVSGYQKVLDQHGDLTKQIKALEDERAGLKDLQERAGKRAKLKTERSILANDSTHRKYVKELREAVAKRKEILENIKNYDNRGILKRLKFWGPNKEELENQLREAQADVKNAATRARGQKNALLLETQNPQNYQQIKGARDRARNAVNKRITDVNNQIQTLDTKRGNMRFQDGTRQLKVGEGKTLLTDEERKQLKDLRAERQKYNQAVSEYNSRVGDQAENARRIKLLESRDKGTVEELLKGHADELAGKGKWLKRAGYGGLALGAGYWGAKKLGLLGGRKQQPQQQYYYQ